MLVDQASDLRATRSMAGMFRRGLAALAATVIAAVLIAPAAHAQTPILHQGNVIITGFSGTAPSATPAASGDPLDNLFIDLNGASMRLQDLVAGGQPPQGQLIASPTVFQAKAGDVGQVFGIAMDDGRGPDGNLSTTPNIYLSASSAFGLQIVQPDASGKLARARTGNPGTQWMPGQWGDPAKGGTPGSIWMVNGATGVITLFADVKLGGQPNSGPGLGNLTFHAKSRQIFVSDLSTGMIHRIDMLGADLGYYDHGTQGRVSQGLPPIADDPANRLDISNPAFDSENAATWHYAQKGRMVWGLRAHGDRLYYATAEGPQIWSISIGQDGSFGADPRMEIDVTGTPANNAISDLTFDGQDYLYLAQRGATRGDYAYKSFAEPAKSVVLRYRFDQITQKWLPAPEEYAVGFPPDYRNTNGGVTLGYAYDQSGRVLPGTCGRMVWTTGELLRQGSGLGGPEIVHGLQGMDRSLVRPSNQPPRQSYFTDYDGAFEDSDVHGHIGNVKIWQPCEPSVGTLIPSIPPGYIPPPTGKFNLTLTKVADPKDCIPGGQGFLCSYRIFITNTGTTIYAGPLTVDDWLPAAPPGAIMTFSPMPPWNCAPVGPGAAQCLNPAVVLFPGQSTELDVVVDLPKDFPDCYLDNVAQIDWPLGYGDANRSDDVGFASTHIPGSHCPPPQGKKTNLRIQKFAKPQCKPLQNGDWECLYVVVVTNTGPAVYNDVIKVDDTLPAGDTATFITPAPWSCADAAPTYHCATPPTTLNVGQSTAFGVLVNVPGGSIKPDNCKVPNKVHISYAPGGSDQNTNPGDDDAVAVANVPSERCLGKQTNLKIEKIAGPCQRSSSQYGTGYACIFGIRVTNTGPGLYNGNIVIDDSFASTPAAAVFAPQPPWNCVGGGANWQCTYAAAVLAPTGHIDLLAAALVSTGNVLEGQCKLKNTAKILSAIPGSPQNNVLGDDSASATATINDPHCDQVPTIPGGDGHVKIEKTCKQSQLAVGLSCRITITNDGGTPLAGTISFADQGTWTGSGAALQISSVTPDDPAIVCSGLPSNLVCTLPGSSLPPGTTHSVEIAIAGGNGQTKYRNCASMVQPNRLPTAAIGTPSCAEGGSGSEISVLKTAPQSCSYGKDCAFQVTITNTSEQSFSGQLLVGDLMSLGGVNSKGVAISSISPPLNCDAAASALPFTCKANASLAGHEAHTHTIVVHMPAAPAGGAPAADGLNCFMAVDAVRAGADTSIAATMTGPGNGPGYSCVAFKMERLEDCPGALVRIGTQCKCPEGTRQGSNHTCGKGSTIVPVPIPIPPTSSCPSGQSKVDGKHCCPRGQSWNGNQCVPPYSPPAKPQCPQGQFKVDGVHCCPRGQSWDGNKCVPPYTPPQCPKGEIKVDGVHCCPRGQTFNGNKCVPPYTPPPPQCPQGEIKVDGVHCCPRGQTFNGNKCVPPYTPPPPQCPQGEIKVDGVHCCPRGSTWDGHCITLNQGGGNAPPKCKGIVINGVCLGNIIVPVKKVCPAPASGYLPNCKCPGLARWNGSKCVPVSDTAPQQPGLQRGPVLKQQFNIPNLQIFKQLQQPVTPKG